MLNPEPWRVRQNGVYEAVWKHEELYKLSYALVFQDQELDHQVNSLHVKLQKHDIKSASGLVNIVRFSSLEMNVISTEKTLNKYQINDVKIKLLCR